MNCAGNMTFQSPHHIADGGETRFHFGEERFGIVTTPGLVRVHDGVRPFVAREVIERCYSLAAGKQAVIPVIDVVETVRHWSAKEVKQSAVTNTNWCKLASI